MKSIIYILFLCFITTIISAQNTKTMKAEIDAVVLYLDGVEVSCLNAIKLEKGRNLVVFEEAAPAIPAPNIRVSVTGDVSVLSIDTEDYQYFDEKVKSKYKTKHDSLQIVENELQMLKDEQEAYKIEKDVLLKNTSIAGQNNGLQAEELRKTVELFRNRILEINKKTTVLANSIEQKQTLNKELKKAVDSLKNAGMKYRTKIKVLFNTETATTETVRLVYLLSNGGWSPEYEISVEDLSKDVGFVYRANVYNNSGIDWKDVKLTLSTTDPWQPATQPKMSAWFIDFHSQDDFSYNNRNANFYSKKQKQAEWDEGYIQNQMLSQDIQIDDDKDFKVVEPTYEEVFVSDLNAEFEVAEKYSVPSDNKPYLVDVTEYVLPAKYKHFAIPKKDRDAFILASITGWEDLNLIEGEAKIFFGGAYIGKSYIYTRNVRDTLDISLGRDNKVLVTRSKLKDYSSTKFIGNKRTETHAYEMVVKNNRKSVIDIEIRDQLPVSENSEIEVEQQNISNGQLDVVKGEIVWNFNLKPGESKKINLAFTIKYPKNKSINIKKRPQSKRQVRKF